PPRSEHPEPELFLYRLSGLSCGLRLGCVLVTEPNAPVLPHSTVAADRGLRTRLSAGSGNRLAPAGDAGAGRVEREPEDEPDPERDRREHQAERGDET